MKILFYDGSLHNFFNDVTQRPDIMHHYLHPAEAHVMVDADDGPTANYKKLKELSEEDFPYYILTNSLVALSHVFGWNDKEKHTDIYLWREKYKDFIRCDRLTLKDIREAHNIEKMYMSDAFDEEVQNFIFLQNAESNSICR